MSSISERALPETGASRPFAPTLGTSNPNTFNPGAFNSCAKLALGTVQWGMSYGIAGRGQPGAAEVTAILDAGKRAGIGVLDTAHAYGTAEAVIGQQDAAASFRIITKTLTTRAPRIEMADIDAIEAALEDSFVRLRRPSVYGVLVHDAGNLMIPGADRLWALLERYRAAGKIERVGVSVYNPDQCRAIMAAFPVQIVQLPFSLYDQRFLDSGVLADLKARDVEIHTRSAFLQGLMLMAPEALPSHFDSIRTHHARFHAEAHANNISPLAAALNFCLRQSAIDYVVVGCEKTEQIEEILAATAAEGQLLSPHSFALADVSIIEPSRWPK